MSIFYFLLISIFLNYAVDQNDNCASIFLNKSFNIATIKYKNKSGEFSLNQIPKTEDYGSKKSDDHSEFEELLSHFEKSMDKNNSTCDENLNAMSALITKKHFALQRGLIEKQINAQECTPQLRFIAVIKRFNSDIITLLENLRSKNIEGTVNKLKKFETHCGFMTYALTKECIPMSDEVEKVLMELYIERDKVSPYDDLLIQVIKDGYKKNENQYDIFRLFCFEQILRFALTNDWDSLYDFPMNVLLNEYLIRAISGKNAHFLFKSKYCVINEVLILKNMQDLIESTLVQLIPMPYRVNSVQMYNNECYLYGKPKIHTPTDYFNYIKDQRKNNWLCKHLQCLYQQANSTGNNSWFTEGSVFDQRLKSIIQEVFKDFGKFDNPHHEPELFS